MKIDPVINAVFDMMAKMKINNPDPNYTPKIAVYMKDSFWHDCMREFTGEVSHGQLEFFERSTILNYPVTRVIKGDHPLFRVVAYE